MAVPLLDLLVAAVVLGNAALVGVAFGAYGARAVPWLVHLPVEWAALGTALALYLTARRRPVGRQIVVRSAVAIAVLVAAAAVTETYLTPQR